MVEDTYIFPQLEADAQAIHDANMDRLRQLSPRWTERDTAVEVLVSRAWAQQVALLTDVMGDVFAAILAEVARVSGVERHEPQPATGTVTVETDGAETYSLPAGATLVGYLPDQSAVVLITTEDTEIPEGTTSVSDVPVQTTSEGLFATLATPQPLQPDQTYTWLMSVTLDELTGIGADGDTDEEYLDRGSRRLALNASQVILPDDVAGYVRDIDGVGRVLTINQMDATDPDDPDSPVDRCVTVVITGPDGAPPTQGLLDEVSRQLQARREANFKFFVVGPTYVSLTIELTVAAWADQLDVAGDAAKSALLAWLSPAAWGGRGYGYGSGPWARTSTVRVGEVVSVADAPESVDYVDPTLVLIGGENADLELDAPIAALPDPDNTTVTVHVVEREP